MKMVPSNVLRCVKDNGPIKYGDLGTPHACENCGRFMYPADDQHKVGYHWEESYGYLVEVETEDDERDTEEEIEDLHSAIGVFADIFGDGMTAMNVGGHFTCTEADRMAKALMEGGHKRAAMTFLEGHAAGDDDEDDIHPDIEDFEAYVLELAGHRVPELIEEPEPEAPAKAVVLAVVTTDELLKLLNLD